MAPYGTAELRDIRQQFGWGPTSPYILLTPPKGNAKSNRAGKHGYAMGMLMLHADRTVVDLTPYGVQRTQQEVVTCPHATHGPTGCVDTCIMYTGRALSASGLSVPIVDARLRRTQWLASDPWSFIAQLVKEMHIHYRRCKNWGLAPVFRLNGTSDLRWERIVPWLFHALDPTEVQFVDYTKWPLTARQNRPSNYTLAKSVQASKETTEDVMDALVYSHVSMICDDPALLIEQRPHLFVDADIHDMWMLDHVMNNKIGLLKPKRPMRNNHPQVYQARELYSVNFTKEHHAQRE